MESSLYLLKMQLLSNIWDMTRREKTIVKKMAQIIVLLYGPYFLRSRLSTPAPRLDLDFVYSLIAYRASEPDAARKGLESCMRHLWYLSPPLVCCVLTFTRLTENFIP